MRSVPTAIILIFLSAGWIHGQSNNQHVAEAVPEQRIMISLEVPVGAPLPVVLDQEVRIRKTGQPIHGKIAEPVFAFDKLVVPAGSEVTGSVTRIAGVSALKRTMAALDSNFSPTRDIEIDFDQLILPGGRRVPLHTHVAPASQGVLQFATAPDPKSEGKGKKQNAAVKLATEKVNREETGNQSGVGNGKEAGDRAGENAPAEKNGHRRDAHPPAIY